MKKKEIQKKQKEKLCKLRKIAAVRRRDLVFHADGEKKENECGLRVNVMKASVHAQHQKLMSSLRKPNAAATLGNSPGPDSLVKLSNMFAPKKSRLLAETNVSCTDVIATSNTETLNYVLPIERFNNFKVIVPKSKLQVTTEDGETIIVEPNEGERISNVNVFHDRDDLLKRHKENQNVLELLNTKDGQHHSKWQHMFNAYIYNAENKKIFFDEQSGKITCYKQPEHITFDKSIVHSNLDLIKEEKIPKLERNVSIEKSCCFSAKTLVRRSLKNYRSTTYIVKKGLKLQKNKMSRLILRRFPSEEHRKETRMNFVIQGTKFGSFIQKYDHLTFNKSRIKNSRNDKGSEEDGLVELRALLPFQHVLDHSRLGLLQSSITYIQELERQIKERLHIPSGELNKEDPPPCMSLYNDALVSSRDTDEDQQVPDMSSIVDQPNTSEDALDDSMSDLFEFTMPFLNQEFPNFEDGSDSCEDQCTMVYEDLFKLLCSEDTNSSIPRPPHTSNIPDGFSTPIFHVNNNLPSSLNVHQNHNLSFITELEPEVNHASEYFRFSLPSNVDSSKEERPEVNSLYKDNYFEQEIGEEFQLNYTDVNLNSLCKKEKTFDDDDACAMESLHNEDCSWKTLISPINMADAENMRSSIFSPISSSEFPMSSPPL